MDHELRERRIEANWRLFRTMSIIAAGTLLVVLLAIDLSFGFSSVRLNVILVLLALLLFIFLRLDFWLHQSVRSIRKRKFRSGKARN